MRILVYEFASGGGLGGFDVPASIAREGAAMRAALVHDLSAAGHRIVTTVDARVRHDLPPEVDIAPLPASGCERTAALDRLFAGVDGVWLIAPETDRCLERLAARVERCGSRLLGSGWRAIHRASDKAMLPQRFAAARVAHPITRVLSADAGDGTAAARAIGYPVVVKPARGAGSHGVGLAANAREVRRALTIARQAAGRGAIVLQEYVAGLPASVSLLADGTEAVALAVNAQMLSAPPCFAYRGGVTPLDHPLAARAAEMAIRACRALPGLRGFVGVDVVVADGHVVVVEVNPRLTTAYLGVRAALDVNVATLALDAIAGRLPPPIGPQRRVRFTSSGEVAVVELAVDGGTRPAAGNAFCQKAIAAAS